MGQAKRSGAGHGGYVSIACPGEPSTVMRSAVRSAVRRMLRLDADLSGFHALCRRSASHRDAATMRFGRLLRGASLFEDVVKIICTCNVGWSQTVAMLDRMVTAWGVPTGADQSRAFPTPEGLAGVGAARLKRIARLGYRAEFVHRLACDVVKGKLDLDAIEQFDGPSGALYEQLRQIHGVGDYAAAHLCMLLGRYDRLAVDTELKRFLAGRHPRRRWTPASLRGCYDEWHPYQFLAYWFELWREYTQRHGEADQWRPEEVRGRITSRPGR